MSRVCFNVSGFWSKHPFARSARMLAVRTLLNQIGTRERGTNLPPGGGVTCAGDFPYICTLDNKRLLGLFCLVHATAEKLGYRTAMLFVGS